LATSLVPLALVFPACCFWVSGRSHPPRVLRGPGALCPVPYQIGIAQSRPSSSQDMAAANFRLLAFAGQKLPISAALRPRRWIVFLARMLPSRFCNKNAVVGDRCMIYMSSAVADTGSGGSTPKPPLAWKRSVEGSPSRRARSVRKKKMPSSSAAAYGLAYHRAEWPNRASAGFDLGGREPGFRAVDGVALP